MFDPRLRAILDLSVPSARVAAGRHEYDGIPQDLSPGGVREGLRRLGGSPYADRHDEAHASAAEQALRVTFGDLELHRVNPMLHVENLELDCYDRDYAPAEDRAAARRRHLEHWPDAVDAAVRSLDRMPVALAEAVLPSVRGLAAYGGPGDPGGPGGMAARAALDRFVRHLETAGGADAPLLGEDGLTKLLGSSEAVEVDLGELTRRANGERDRLRQLLAEACSRLLPCRPTSPLPTHWTAWTTASAWSVRRRLRNRGRSPR